MSNTCCLPVTTGWIGFHPNTWQNQILPKFFEDFNNTILTMSQAPQLWVTVRGSFFYSAAALALREGYHKSTNSIVCAAKPFYQPNNFLPVISGTWRLSQCNSVILKCVYSHYNLKNNFNHVDQVFGGQLIIVYIEISINWHIIFCERMKRISVVFAIVALLPLVISSLLFPFFPKLTMNILFAWFVVHKWISYERDFFKIIN